jgi:uncharacterized repeat protein (TIGR01451 family)
MSKYTKVAFRLIDLVVIFVMTLGSPMSALAATAQQPALVTIPTNFFTVVDAGGPNDEVSQSDLTQMGRDDTDPTVYKLFWSWDSTDDWTGTGQTGDACALFDSDGDGNINQAICVRINNPNANPAIVSQVVGATDGDSPFVWTCSDAKPDRCTNPSGPLAFTSTQLQAGVLGTLAASPPGNLITDTDPFTNLDSTQNWPNDSTIEIRVLKSYLVSGATLVNVCSYPSAGNGGNNDPKDCIVTPGGGFLVITKIAPTGTTQTFSFAVNPGSISKTITGSGSTTPIALPLGTSYSVAETIPTGWKLDAASCAIEGGTSTGTKSGSTISSIEVKSGKITTCTFTDSLVTGTLTIVKNLVNDNLGPKTCSDFSYQVNGGTAVPFESDCSNNKTVLPGSYTVVEVGAPIAGYTTTYNNCTNVAVTAGGTATCTITNDDIAVPSLSLVKTASPATYSAVGQTISYSYVVKNTGNVTLFGISVVDDKATVTCPDTSAGLAPAGTITCTASYTITQADLDLGSVKNTAYATDGTTQSEPDSETVTADQEPALALAKIASPTIYDAAGDVIHYSYLLTNTGNVTLSGPFSVSDDKAAVTCPATVSLVPTEFTTCTASYVITQADLDLGSVSNTAKAHGFFGTTPVDSNEDSETVLDEQNPALTIDKTAT